MKKLVQISIVVVLVLVLFQAMLGGTFSASGSVLANEPQSQSAASASVQSALVITCKDVRVVRCVVPNVGWNS